MTTTNNMTPSGVDHKFTNLFRYEFPSTSLKLPRRRSKVMTVKKLIEQVRMGFGQGHGSNYQSWLKIRRKNPSPVSNQVVSWMPPLGRTAHYFSRGEYQLALLLLWLGVSDLREQFPLWPIPHPHPLEGAQGSEGLQLAWSRGLLAIAEEAGIKHGVEFGTDIPYVATVDQLATVRLSSGLKLVGFSSKAITDPNDEVKERTLERLELERRYLNEIDAGHFVTNASMVPSLMAGQLEWWLDCSTLHCSPELLPIAKMFATNFNNRKDQSIADAVKGAAKQLLIFNDEAWLLFRHCAWMQLIDIDPTKRVLTSHPANRGGLALRSRLRQELFGEDWQ